MSLFRVNYVLKVRSSTSLQLTKLVLLGAGWVSTSIDFHFINFQNNLDALSHKRSF